MRTEIWFPSTGWRPQDFDILASMKNEPRYVKHKNKPWESPEHSLPHASSGLFSARDSVSSQSSGPSFVLEEVDRASTTSLEKQDAFTSLETPVQNRVREECASFVEEDCRNVSCFSGWKDLKFQLRSDFSTSRILF